MAGNVMGKLFSASTFGESHGKAVGVVVDGCPSKFPLTEEDVQRELDRRRPGQSELSSPRTEKDRVEILSGVFQGLTTGTPICLIVFNRDMEPGDYAAIRDRYRPGHGDWSYQQKYGIRDYQGGGRSSARETIGRVCAGAIAKKVLAGQNVKILGHVIQVGSIRAAAFDPAFIEKNPVRCADREMAEKMAKQIHFARDKGDSIGGIVEVRATGLPPGIGEPVFDRLDAALARAILSIPAVKGIEFGSGFEAAEMTGSTHNDEMTADGFASNHAGGMLGGISTGQDIVFRFPVKPTSSIRVPQRTVDRNGNEVKIITEGRHDPCIAPRVVPVAEAMTAIVLLDLWMQQKARTF
ncbi:MAG: chorismate synthase [Acidobacteria bacterium]|nr:chorismate synthase [Acidobacteriota bacterium]